MSRRCCRIKLLLNLMVCRNPWGRRVGHNWAAECFLNVELYAKFFTFLFHFHQEAFSSSLSAIRVVSSAYLRLLIFLPAILIPACASSSPTFHMMHSACKLNKQGDSIHPWQTPFPVCNQSLVPCPVLTVASWTAYRFLRRQVRWSGIPISLRIFQFVVIHIVKGFSIVNEVDVFSGTPLPSPWSKECW